MFKIRIFLFFVIFFASAMVYAGDFVLTSPTIGSHSFLTEKQVYNGFGCTGENQSPALKWEGAPKGTRSFAVTVYDPDAPTGSGWWHWILYNIPGNVTELQEDAGRADSNLLPSGAIQGRNDYGTRAFGGACPPKGDKPHRYIFTVFALKIEKLDVPPDASAALVGFMINSNSLGKASFTVKYGR